MKKVTGIKTKLNKVYSKFNTILVFLLIVLLPTQLGKHFFLPFSYLSGVRVDYLAPTIYLINIVVFFLALINIRSIIAVFKQRLFLLMTILFVPNIIFAQSIGIASYQYARMLELIIVGIIAYKHIISEKALLVGLLLTALFQLILAILQLMTKHSLQGIFYFFGERYITLSLPGIAKASLNGVEFLRPYGTFSHPNSLGGFFLLLYILILINKRFNKLFLLKYFSLFICSLLVFISFSKVAIVTYVILNVYYLLSSSKIPCQFCKWVRIIILTVVAALFMQTQADPLTVQKRLELAGNAFKIIVQHPVIGVGIGNYLIAQNQFSSKFSYFFNQPVHNIFLLLFAELGIPLGVFICYLLFRLFKKNLSTIYLLLVAIFITGFFDHYWFTLQQNFLLAGFIIGVSLRRRTV